MEKRLREYINGSFINISTITLTFIAIYPCSNFDFPLTTKGGVRLEILLNATTRRNEHGHIIGEKSIYINLRQNVCFIFLISDQYLHSRNGWNWPRYN